MKMDLPGSVELWLGELSGKTNYAHILTNLALILVATIVIYFLKLLNCILEPMNYELDMTTKKYCKTLAEIDNSLRPRRGRNSELHLNNQLSAATAVNNSFDHCATNQRLPATAAVGAAAAAANSHTFAKAATATERNSQLDATQQTGSANHIYPNGWIPVIESLKVRPGCVKKAIIFGIDVIVTRSADGKQVNVLDAYCPHMGVHIGVGGRVRQVDSESCIECPFHGWTFRASDGVCVKIPYQRVGDSSKSPTIPKQAKLGTWPCVEVDNFIYIWHHIDNQPPTWHLTPSIQMQSDNWQLAGRSCHRTNLELRDMHENGADMNHFEGIHNDLFVLGGEIIKLRPLNYLQDYVRHHWLPEWRPMVNEAGKMTHMAEMKLQSWISLFKLRLFDITVRANQIGPARVNLYYDSKWYGTGLLIMNAIPMGGRQTKYIQHIYTKRTLFQCFMAKWVLYGEIKQLERDFFIWNHKKNIKNPIFIPEDKALKQFRLWYSQFYKRKHRIVIQNSGDENLNNNNNIEAKPAVASLKASLEF